MTLVDLHIHIKKRKTGKRALFIIPIESPTPHSHIKPSMYTNTVGWRTLAWTDTNKLGEVRGDGRGVEKLSSVLLLPWLSYFLLASVHPRPDGSRQSIAGDQRQADQVPRWGLSDSGSARRTPGRARMALCDSCSLPLSRHSCRRWSAGSVKRDHFLSLRCLGNWSRAIGRHRGVFLFLTFRVVCSLCVIGTKKYG